MEVTPKSFWYSVLASPSFARTGPDPRLRRDPPTRRHDCACVPTPAVLVTSEKTPSPSFRYSALAVFCSSRTGRDPRSVVVPPRRAVTVLVSPTPAVLVTSGGRRRHRSGTGCWPCHSSSRKGQDRHYRSPPTPYRCWPKCVTGRAGHWKRCRYHCSDTACWPRTFATYRSRSPSP